MNAWDQIKALGIAAIFYCISFTVIFSNLKAPLFPLYLFSQSLQAVQESLPEVLEQGPVDLLQAVPGAGIHTDIQLGHWLQTPLCRQKKNVSACLLAAAHIHNPHHLPSWTAQVTDAHQLSGAGLGEGLGEQMPSGGLGPMCSYDTKVVSHVHLALLC